MKGGGGETGMGGGVSSKPPEPPLDPPQNPGATGYSFQIILFFLSEDPLKQCLSKQCRPWWNAAFTCIYSVAFHLGFHCVPKYPFTGIQTGQTHEI